MNRTRKARTLFSMATSKSVSSNRLIVPMINGIMLTFLLPLALLAAEKTAEKDAKKPVASINIVGTGGMLYKNLELNLPTRIPECHETDAQIAQFIKSIKKRFRGAARAIGFYDAQFTPNIRMVNGCWKITVNVAANRPIKVTQTNFVIKGEGLTQKEFRVLSNTPPYRSGDVLNHQKYSDYKAQLKETAQTFGYFNAAFETHKIVVNPLKFTAVVSLVFNTGKRFRYGKISVEQGVLNKEVIQRFLQIKEGDLYSSEKLISQQQLLQSSGFYADISIDALHKQAVNQQIPIKISLRSKKRNEWKFKVGYGTDTGPRVSAQLNRRWTGAKGHNLLVNFTAAPKVSTFTARMAEPKADPEEATFAYLFEWEQDPDGDTISRNYKLGGEYARTTSSDWKQTAFLTYLLETTQEGDNNPTKSHLTLLGVEVEKTKADNYLFPLNGWHPKGKVHGAIDKLLSDQSILQFEISTKLITKLGKGRLLTRLDLGATLVGDFESLPKSLRFFAGGGQSVRGYSFNSLGAKNTDGDIVGGKHLLVGSVEYDYPVLDKWSVAVFVDAGNAFNDWKSSDLKLGAGIGARWNSPVGPVRIDIGFPENRISDPHLHLSIGADL
jgi:translocation and assembly module TamA